MDLKELDLLGDSQDRHWYFVSKSRALLQALDGRPATKILDVGAGSGFFSQILLRETSAQSAICVDPGYSADRTDTCAGKPIAFVRSTGPADSDADLVLLMDVLEHVNDDLGLVRDVAARTRPGTRFVVSVPAFSWLWSGHDVFLEHRRRYTLKGVLRVLSAAGLTPLRGFYFFGLVFPAVAAQRLWQHRSVAPASQLRRHHPLTNQLLTTLCSAEASVARHNRLFGLTAFAVAERP
jgi:SAM-dependent methyltransferase